MEGGINAGGGSIFITEEAHIAHAQPLKHIHCVVKAWVNQLG